MKGKLINFIAAMGIPVSGITTQGAGCTGICGSCSLNCAPGIVALLLLAGKAIYKRYHGEVMQHEQANVKACVGLCVDGGCNGRASVFPQ